MIARLIFLFCLLSAQVSASPALALNKLGDLVGGSDIVNPLASAVVADTGALISGGTTGGYYRIDGECSSTITTSFQVGSFTGAGVAVKTMKVMVSGNQSYHFSIPSLFVLDGNHVQVDTTANVLGTVNCFLALKIMGSD